MKHKKWLVNGVGLFSLLFSLLLPSGIAGAVALAPTDANAGPTGDWISQTQISYNGQTFTDYGLDGNWTFQSSNKGCFNIIHNFVGGQTSGHLANPTAAYYEERHTDAATGKCLNTNAQDTLIGLNDIGNSQADFVWQNATTINAATDISGGPYVQNKANGVTATDGLYYEQSGDSCKDTLQIQSDTSATLIVRTGSSTSMDSTSFNNSHLVIYNDVKNAGSNVQNKTNGCYVFAPVSVAVSNYNNARNGGGSGGGGGAGTCADGSTPDANGICKDGTDATLDCGGGTLNWIVCPVITLAQGAAEKVDGFITNTMDIDVGSIFDNTGQAGSQQNGYYQAWSQFRLLATAFLLIGGLIMVVSQGLGFEFLDAYTVRKVLPRLLIAAVGISLSWPLMRYFVQLFDVIGFDIRDLIYAPFSHLGGHISIGMGIASYFALAAGAFALGFASLTFILTALLAIFVGFLILVVREIGIILMVILAPIAIASYVLPNTQKLWKLWRDNFIGLMIMFPIISAFIAIGHVFSAVALSKGGNNVGSNLSQIIGIVAYFMPYFLLPVAFRLATGSIGTIAGFINDRHRGAFDRLKQGRQRALQNNWQKTRNFQRFSDRNALTRGINTLAGAAVTPRQTIHGRAGIREARRAGRTLQGGEAWKNDRIIQANQNDDNFLLALANEDLAVQKIRQVEAKRDAALGRGDTAAASAAQAEIDGRQSALNAARQVTSRHSAGTRLTALNNLAKTGYQFSAGDTGYQELASTVRSITGGDEGAYALAMNEAQYHLKNAGRLEQAGINYGANNNIKSGIRKMGNYGRGQGKPDTYSGGARAWLGADAVDADGKTKSMPEIATGIGAAVARGETSFDDVSEWHSMLLRDKESATDANKLEIQKQIDAIEAFGNGVNAGPTPATEAELDARTKFVNDLRMNRATMRNPQIDPSELNK